ncbi:XRE family transcriptional regulator [Falsochrobactrum shanghaiense]|uniref:XRE family transcriptional regulator n=1 Tax=Falsochrobactrum shanghaiense TaxID=2201899 RepID=A0A316JR20_9HYPH|nr:XRE family transcriptional regulator [Falsochrobactrum shanghaiense]PWL17670.1 XRE family transcriptional regulator [Falsochrobactrum shanghaiense]
MAFDKNAPSIGEALRERRSYHGWTLADVAAKTGISKSTLSKIENDLISPSYQTILQLCAGLGIEIGDLISKSTEKNGGLRPLTGRRSVSRGTSGLTMSDEHFTYTYLCTDIAHKRIIPMIIEVRAHSLNEINGLWTHVGEEYLYVLEGSIELQTELYEPTVLEAGDSAYFDSTMGHAYLAAGDKPAKLLVMCSSATPNLAQVLREVLSERLDKRGKAKTAR